MEKAKVALLAVIAMLLAGILFTLATQKPEVITETVTEEPQAWSEDSVMRSKARKIFALTQSTLATLANLSMTKHLSENLSSIRTHYS